MAEPEKRPQGRPVTNTPPPKIPDTAEAVADAILNTPPKTQDEWRYLNKRKEAS